MAGKEWHSWGKVTVLAVVIIFSCGGYAMQTNTNTGGIKTLKAEAKEDRKAVVAVKDSVHLLQLADKDIANLAQKSVDYMGKIEKHFIEFAKVQQQQAILLDRNTTKLDTLTKDK